MHNNFKPIEFNGLRRSAGLNSFSDASECDGYSYY